MTYNPMDIDEFQACLGIVYEIADTHDSDPYTVVDIANMRIPQPVVKCYGILDLIEAAEEIK